MCEDGSCGRTTEPFNQEALSETLLTVGDAAMEAAMKALTDTVEAGVPDENSRERVAALAGA
jgi:hypothetical protein